jgi:hypothetical protein
MATVRKFPLVLGLMEVNSEEVEQGLGNFVPTDNKHTQTLCAGWSPVAPYTFDIKFRFIPGYCVNASFTI